LTTVVVYLSMDYKGPSGITLMSDSRVTWTVGSKSVARYDHSQKLFFLRESPSVFGYCGDSLFSLAALSQITTALDLSYEYIRSSSIQHKVQLVEGMLRNAAAKYPFPLEASATQVIQITRIEQTFYMCEFIYNANTKGFEGSSVELKANEESRLLGVWGSGTQFFKEVSRYMVKHNGQFARVYYRSLVLQLECEYDEKSGGPPQMIALGRDKTATPVGIRHKDETFLVGLRYSAGETLQGTEFRNEYYEFVGENGVLCSNSQQHRYNDWKQRT
jgi:hypothetical protein